MGSDSDWPVVKGACTVLKDFGVPYEAHILSAHRTPEAAAAFARSARAEGYGVILCAAGMAAHLAGAFAANTTLPVVGIPMKGGAMDGLDALLATVQMPSGFPVATVALNGAKNAAYLAVAILAVADDELAAKLDSFRADTAAAVASVTAAVAVFGLGAGYVYDDRHTLEIGAVQGVDGALTLALVGHLDKAETARTSGLPVCDDVSRRYLSVLCEKCLQTLACRAEVQF